MRALTAVFVFAAVGCSGGGTTTTTTTSRVENTGGPTDGSKTTNTPPDKDPDVDLSPKVDMTLAEAETVVTRVVALMGELVGELEAVSDDCTKFVPTFVAWETKNAEEQATLEQVGAKIPPQWANGELVDHFLKMEEHGRSLQAVILACKENAQVRDYFGLDSTESP